jgi:ABC-type dipeptide/oligopeptide/nickel transport system ATPase component
MTKSLLEVKNLTVEFQGGNKAVDDISFSIAKGEAVAVVGESGSGKSVTALALTRLLPPPPSCLIDGKILYREKNLLTANGQEIRSVRGKEIAYIFQEPSTSLNPVFSIGYQIAEAIKLHRPEIKNVKEEIIRVMNLVGIRNSAQRYQDYPHQFSGGMQQRAMIAMALACQPQLLVADEPTTALDVTIQAQIIDLLKELKAKLGMSILLITHNFGIVSGFADRVIVMFRGKIVESGPTQEVLKNPQHPYTKALIECIPQLGQKKERLTTIDYSKIN